MSKKYAKLSPYTPGEQPQDMKYVKLNTNESPYPPSEKAVKYAAEAAGRMQLYPDPECRELTEKIEPLLDEDTMVVKIEILSQTARRFVIR